MPVMEPREIRKVIAELRDARMSQAEITYVLLLAAHGDGFNPFAGMTKKELRPILNKLLNDYSSWQVVFDGTYGLAGTLVKFAKEPNAHDVVGYRYTIRTQVTKDRSGIQYILTDNYDPDYPFVMVGELTEDMLFDLDMIKFEGESELWDEVED